MAFQLCRRAIATRFPSRSALLKRVWHCSRLIGQVVNRACCLDRKGSLKRVSRLLARSFSNALPWRMPSGFLILFLGVCL